MLSEFKEFLSNSDVDAYSLFRNPFFIESGLDSLVFKNLQATDVYKLYCIPWCGRILEYRQLLLYRGITNMIANDLEQDVFTLPFEGQNLRVKVVPIDEIGQFQLGRNTFGLAKSRFVPGKNFADSFANDEISRLQVSLEELSLRLNLTYRSSGIFLRPCNIKRDIQAESQIIVTDLCESVALLKYKRLF